MEKILSECRRVKFEYHLEDFFTAGMVLEGWEVKSILSGKASLNEAYVRIIGDEVVLIGAHIAATGQFSKFSNLDPTRSRKLLLNKHEISKLIGKVQISGFTLVPVKMIYKNRRIKLEIALAKGKKDRDKRENIKNRDASREIDVAMKALRIRNE